MSWSRLSSTSAIYTFPHVAGGAECCGCPLLPMNESTGFHQSFRAYTLDDFLSHIAEHVEARHNVPPGLVSLIREEWDQYAKEAS